MTIELLDFGEASLEASHFGRSRAIAWPVCAYRVTMPAKTSNGSGELNPFERVVLGLLNSGGSTNESALADETCIPVDFVRGVLLRLCDRGIIDKQNKITNKKALDATPEYNAAIVFREMVGGKVLPHLHAGQLETKQSDVNWILRRSSKVNARLTPKEVIKAAKDMRKHSKAYGSGSFSPALGQINIADSYECYHIECPIVMWEKDGDFRVVDPFAKGGYSLVLEKVLADAVEEDESFSNWLTNWRKSLSSFQRKIGNQQKAEPFDNDVCRRRYPELVSALRLKKSSLHRSLETLHAALEWALFYSCMKYNYRDALNILKMTPQTEQSETLEYAARKIGMEVPPEKFRPLKESSLSSFLNGEPDLNTVLAIALVLAGDDESHPFHSIASEYPGFVARVQSIKRSRDQSGHGKGYAARQYDELPDEPFVRDVVSALLPDIQFAGTADAATTEEAIIDARFDARTSLLEWFGYGAFNNRLCDIAKDRLTNAESFYLSFAGGEDALPFAIDIYSALQAVFRKKLGGSGIPQLPEAEYIASATEKLQNAGLGVLSQELRTVKLRWVHDALQGDDQSLGAAAVAYILASDDETLGGIAGLQQDFFDCVAEVIRVRGHGNLPVPLSKDEITALRKTAYSAIKVLMEA
jgi:hypothetical protein